MGTRQPVTNPGPSACCIVWDTGRLVLGPSPQVVQASPRLAALGTHSRAGRADLGALRAGSELRVTCSGVRSEGSARCVTRPLGLALGHMPAALRACGQEPLWRNLRLASPPSGSSLLTLPRCCRRHWTAERTAGAAGPQLTFSAAWLPTAEDSPHPQCPKPRRRREAPVAGTGQSSVWSLCVAPLPAVQQGLWP